jgi:hypothetical protein
MLRVVCLLALGATAVSCSSESPPLEAASAEPVVSHADHASTPHGDHSPHYGGTVYMKGDLHFEIVVDPSGRHRVYFSDASRAELPAATASEVTLTVSSGRMPPETLPGHVDESGESWIVSGSPLKGSDVTVRVAFVVADEPYWIDVPYVPGTAVNRAVP